MSVHHPIAESILLVMVVLGVWTGVIGMLRMKEPTQALHYLALPAVAGVILVIAVFVETGAGQASFKTLAIAFMMLAVNSVVAHATARAFRGRAIGHWQPRDGDHFEFVRDTKELDQ